MNIFTTALLALCFCCACVASVEGVCTRCIEANKNNQANKNTYFYYDDYVKSQGQTTTQTPKR